MIFLIRTKEQQIRAIISKFICLKTIVVIVVFCSLTQAVRGLTWGDMFLVRGGGVDGVYHEAGWNGNYVFSMLGGGKMDLKQFYKDPNWRFSIPDGSAYGISIAVSTPDGYNYKDPADCDIWSNKFGLIQIHIDHIYLDIPKESNNPDADKNTKEPINTINGNMVHNELDVIIPCPGIDLEFRRSYNSGMDYTNGVLGPRWINTYDWHLSKTNLVLGSGNYTNDSIQILNGEGRLFTFTESGTNNNRWRSHQDNDWEINLTTNNVYELYTESRIKYLFDTNGILLKISDPWNNSITLSYSNNLLMLAEHSNGQYLNFKYQNNLLAEVLTPSANLTISYVYNSYNELTGVTRSISSGDFVTTYAYDSASSYRNHSLTQRVNSAGDVFSYTYATNASGETLSRCTDMVLNGNYYQHTVDYNPDNSNSVVTYKRNGTDLIYTNLYNPDIQRITKIYGPSFGDLVRTYNYDKILLNATKETIEDKSINEFIQIERKYNTTHRVIEESYGYCSISNNIWLNEWDTTYDALTLTTDPEGHKTGFEYTNGTLTKVKLYYDDSNSYDTVYSYTANGLLSAVTNANGHWVKYSYNSYGFPTVIEPQTGPASTFVYSQLGYLTDITVPDNNGNRTTIFEPDELGRIKKITYPDNLIENFFYDSLGNLTNHIDTAGRITSYTYLPTRKLAGITRHLGSTNITTVFDYDNQFNTLKITDPEGRSVETYLLDLQDRPVSITNLEGQTMTVTYGIKDYIKSITRFDGTAVSNKYDSEGRLYRVIYPDNEKTFTYYSNNLLKTAVNELGSVSNSYNFANRLVSSIGTVPESTVNYSYYPAGQVSNVTCAAGTITYSMDVAERVESIKDSVSAFNYTYNTNNGLISKMACTNTGVIVEYVYDSMDRITGIQRKDSASNILENFIYNYNNAGMITQKLTTINGRLKTDIYEYDDLDRLISEISESSDTTAVKYAYDKAGNRVKKVTGDITVYYNYPYGTKGNRLTGWRSVSTNDFASQRVLALTGYSSETIGTNPAFGQLWVSNEVAKVVPVIAHGTNFIVESFLLGLGTNEIVAAIGDTAGNVTYTTNTISLIIVTNGAYGYNPAGCVTGITYSGEGYINSIGLNWNGQYQLTSAFTNEGIAVSYQYDVSGRRVAVISGGTTNYLIYDDLHVIAEVDGNGVLQKSYTWGPGIDNMLSFTDHSTSNTYYALTDHLGTIHAFTDESGNIVESYEFDAFGRVLGVYDGDGQPIKQSAIGNRYLWQGREYSWNTGIYYFRARWYDPVTGRWLSKDPIGISGGLNQYVFVGNNPVNYVDPLGLETLGLGARGSIGLLLQFSPTVQGTFSVNSNDRLNWRDWRIGIYAAFDFEVTTGIGGSAGGVLSYQDVDSPECGGSGWSNTGGASATIPPVVFGYDISNYPEGPLRHEIFAGAGAQPSIVPPVPAEVHVGRSLGGGRSVSLGDIANSVRERARRIRRWFR